MKIGLIRHFPVKHAFLRGLVSQQDVLRWFGSYNTAGVIPLEVTLTDNWESCYSSELKRAKLTARHLYKGSISYSSLLNEPSPDPVFKSNIKLPFFIWGLIFRILLLNNHRSQTQRKEVISTNLNKKLCTILQEEKDTLIIGHSFTMEILSRLLIKQGFSGKIIKRPRHGILYTFTK